MYGELHSARPRRRPSARAYDCVFYLKQPVPVSALQRLLWRTIRSIPDCAANVVYKPSACAAVLGISAVVRSCAIAAVHPLLV